MTGLQDRPVVRLARGDVRHDVRVLSTRGRAIIESPTLPQLDLPIAPDVLDRIVLSLIVVTVLAVLRVIFTWVVDRRTENVRLRYRAKKLATYTVTTLAIFLVGSVWFSGFGSVSTFLGLLSAGLAIALKDMIASIAGWFYILGRKPFEVGDRIAIGEHAGDVIDQRLFRFSMLEIGNWVDADQSTGRVIHVPNSHVFTATIANYTAGFAYIWNELPVLVTFESDWSKAKQILQRIADERCSQFTHTAAEAIRRAARSQMIVYSKLDPKVWTSVADCGVLLTLRYLCDPRQRRNTAELIWEDILHEFAAADNIDFAYPTIRRYINTSEGKPGAGGPSVQRAAEPALSSQE
jgi:small-conductance mechanosensitive channel